SSSSMRTPRGSGEPLEGDDGRGIGDAVDAGGAEMPLKGGDHHPCLAVVEPVARDSVAVAGEALLQFAHRRPLVAKLQDGAAADRLRLDVVADAGTVKASPVELLAGVDLARRRHVRVGEDALGRDGVAGDDVPAQRLEGDKLRFRKVGIEGVVAGVLYLDPDRARVDVAFSRPERHTRVPGAVGFVDHPHYA